MNKVNVTVKKNHDRRFAAVLFFFFGEGGLIKAGEVGFFLSSNGVLRVVYIEASPERERERSCRLKTRPSPNSERLANLVTSTRVSYVTSFLLGGWRNATGSVHL